MITENGTRCIISSSKRTSSICAIYFLICQPRHLCATGNLKKDVSYCKLRPVGCSTQTSNIQPIRNEYPVCRVKTRLHRTDSYLVIQVSRKIQKLITLKKVEVPYCWNSICWQPLTGCWSDTTFTFEQGNAPADRAQTAHRQSEFISVHATSSHQRSVAAMQLGPVSLLSDCVRVWR